MARALVVATGTIMLMLMAAGVAAIVDGYTDFGVKKGVHGWRGPKGNRYIVVDSTGNGHFRSVQDAVDAVPHGNRLLVTIFIRPGIYNEKVTVDADKPYIVFQGAGKEKTVIEWHNKASDIGPDGVQLHTYNSASVTVLANHFTARNISFKNSSPAPLPGLEGYQAVALRVAGDKSFFFGCGFYGAQDTLCDDYGRHVYSHCFIQGSIDFIFGNARSLFFKCELHSVASVFGSIAAQARGSEKEKTGFSFVGCRVTGSGPLYLGRAMASYSRIVYAFTYFDNIVAGWDDWDHQTPRQDVFFGVYRCDGPGAAAALRVPWVRQLTALEAQKYVGGTFVNAPSWLRSL